jgi:3-dehydroquinate synthetase
LPKIPSAKLRSILAGDKKSRGGRVLWVLPRRIGKAKWGYEVPWKVVERALDELLSIAAQARA